MRSPAALRKTFKTIKTTIKNIMMNSNNRDRVVHKKGKAGGLP